LRILSLFRRRSPRLIFEFHDGTRRRWVDPVVAWQELTDRCGCDPAELILKLSDKSPAFGGLAESMNRAKDDAAAKLSDAVCAAFGVEPLSDASGKPVGLTRPERVALVGRLASYLGGLAAEARPFAG
jgi:hypothetical protein